MRFASVCGLMALLMLTLIGCGGKVTKTPEGTTRAYVNLMKAGKYKDAALLWDYSDQTKQNPDFDTAAPSQRKLIIGKLADEKASSLSQWSSHFGSDLKIETVETTGERARAVLNGRISGLDLVKVGDEWLISGMN